MAAPPAGERWSFLEAVKIFWEGDPSSDRGPLRLESVLLDSTGVRAAYGRACPGELVCWPVLRGTLGRWGWQGGDVAAFISGYRSPGVPWEDRWTAGECFQSLALGFIMRFRGGSTVPLIVFFRYDSATSQWWMTQIGMPYYEMSIGGNGF